MDIINRQIVAYLIGDECPEDCNIVKKRHAKLSAEGDLCFTLDKAAWRKFQRDIADADNSLKFDKDELIRCSWHWEMPIERVEVDGSTCKLFFNRTECFRRFFRKEALRDTPGQILESTPIESTADIHSYRRILARTIMDRILSTYERSTESPSDDHHISVGPCLDPDTRKASKYSYADYLQKRSTDMQLIAQHKYGLRAQNESRLVELTERLGRAAVIVDLMEVKISTPVTLMGRNHSVPASSKGASFILYNSARIETLFRLYQERLVSGYYPAEPVEIDWTLLKEEDEWMLFFNFLVEYDDLIARIRQNNSSKNVSIHYLCSFLYKLVGLFSVYYRRTKILTENRPQLLPALFARMQLLRAIRRILNEMLFILGIEPVQQM